MTALLAIDFDHVIGSGMCIAAALVFAVGVVLEGRRGEDEQ